MDRNYMQKEVEKKLKYKSLMYRDAKNVEHEMYGNNWRQWNNNKTFKEKFQSHGRKTLNRFDTKDITHSMENTAV